MILLLLNLGKQEVILGPNGFDGDAINAAGTEFGGARLFTVGNICLSDILPSSFTCYSSSLFLALWKL